MKEQTTEGLHQALHEAQLLSARLKRTRTDYANTDLNELELVNKPMYPVFEMISKAIKTLEDYEHGLINKIAKQP
jgi:hypothetical protein